jgi:hypothetical protein
VLSLWIGGIALFTFIITPVIFKSYPRDMAGEIVGQLFPGYFLYNLILSFLALILFLLTWTEMAQKGPRMSLFCLVIAVLINIFVCFKLHPEIKVIKKEIHSFETVSNDDPLRKKFRRLHALSAALNLLLLADGVSLLLTGTVKKRSV